MRRSGIRVVGHRLREDCRRGCPRDQWVAEETSLMIEIDSMGANLQQVAPGVWASSETGHVSFPEGDHDRCFQLEERSFWFQHRNRCLVAAMRRFPPPGTLFDVGGGNGFVTLALRENRFDAILVEPGWDGVRNARLRGLSPVICATLVGAGFRPHSLPAMGMFDVLEHVEDDLGMLRDARTCLMAEGRLYMTVPAYGFLWSRDDTRAGHFRRYTRESLAGTLREAGFAVEYSTYMFSFLVPFIYLLRTLPAKLRVPPRPGKARSEHRWRGGLAGTLLRVFLRAELERIRRGRRIGFGGSLLVACRPD